MPPTFDVGGLDYNSNMNKGQKMEQPSISRAHEVIAGIRAKRVTDSALAHAYAFGWVWSMLTDEQRLSVLADFAEKDNN